LIFWGLIVCWIEQGYCCYPYPLIVFNKGTGYRNEGKERREGGKEQRKQGPQGTDTMQQGGQQGGQEHPDTKPQKIETAPREQHPPLSKINHFGFANFLRAAIYNPITQHI